MLSKYFADYNKAWAYCNLRNRIFFSVFSTDIRLFQALGHKARPFQTKIDFQIENKICYRNISQITMRPGLIVICESTFFSVFSAAFRLFQALGHISQITISPGFIVISKIAQLGYFVISQIRTLQ